MVMNEIFEFIGVEQGAESYRKALRANRAHHYRLYRMMPRYIYHSKLLGQAKRFLPSQLKQIIKASALLAEYENVPRWDPDVRAAVVQQLTDDAEKFLTYAGKPLDFWDLTP